MPLKRSFISFKLTPVATTLIIALLYRMSLKRSFISFKLNSVILFDLAPYNSAGESIRGRAPIIILIHIILLQITSKQSEKLPLQGHSFNFSIF